MKKNRCVTIDEEVWQKLQEIADKNFTNKSAMIQRLILKESEQKTEKE